MFKFIHAADVHLDSPLRGLAQYEGAPVDELRQATREALGNLVDLALAESVAFVLIAGDLYDGDWEDYNTGLHFTGQLRRLRNADIGVYLISGNHDAASKLTRELKLGEAAYQFAVDAPGTQIIDDLSVAIHGQGFATPAVMDDLSLDYPQAVAGCLNIGMLHTCATGSKLHAAYAPCTIDGLRSKGYDYWALGHVHQRQTLLDDDAFIAFSGNLQGRHIRETGPKGCLLVAVDDDHKIDSCEFRELDVVRWERCIIDGSEADSDDDLLEALSQQLKRVVRDAGERLCAVRVEFEDLNERVAAATSRSDHWTNEVRNQANLAGDRVWIEKVKTRRAAQAAPAEGVAGPFEELQQLLSEVRDGSLSVQSLTDDLRAVRDKLDADTSGELGQLVQLDDPDWLNEVLTDVEQLLASRCLRESEV